MLSVHVFNNYLPTSAYRHHHHRVDLLCDDKLIPSLLLTIFILHFLVGEANLPFNKCTKLKNSI